MAAGVEGVDHGGSMYAVRGADVNRIGLDFLEHDFPVFEERFFRKAPFGFHHIKTFLKDIDACDNLNFGNAFVGFQVSLCDSAASDDCHAELFAFVCGLFRVHCE